MTDLVYSHQILNVQAFQNLANSFKKVATASTIFRFRFGIAINERKSLIAFATSNDFRNNIEIFQLENGTAHPYCTIALTGCPNFCEFSIDGNYLSIHFTLRNHAARYTPGTYHVHFYHVSKNRVGRLDIGGIVPLGSFIGNNILTIVTDPDMIAGNLLYVETCDSQVINVTTLLTSLSTSFTFWKSSDLVGFIKGTTDLFVFFLRHQDNFDTCITKYHFVFQNSLDRFVFRSFSSRFLNSIALCLRSTSTTLFCMSVINIRDTNELEDADDNLKTGVLKLTKTPYHLNTNFSSIYSQHTRYIEVSVIEPSSFKQINILSFKTEHEIGVWHIFKHRTFTLYYKGYLFINNNILILPVTKRKRTTLSCRSLRNFSLQKTVYFETNDCPEPPFLWLLLEPYILLISPGHLINIYRRIF
jgi:hypothetical protein